jgi:hypothetical protein
VERSKWKRGPESLLPTPLIITGSKVVIVNEHDDSLIPCRSERTNKLSRPEAAAD